MPLMKMEERHDPVSLRSWKSGQVKDITFLDEGRDVQTANGPSVVCSVRLGDNAVINSLWIRPGGSLHIALNDWIPLKGKKLAISKEILKGKDEITGTRYHAKLLKQEKI